ncbi:MAG: hypothetical protein IJQ82_09990 [Selenomonadaceae bacterium]|nr:hypothetical protein [Selenomonadaceae bacterium]
MTDKTENALNDLYSNVMDYKGAQYRIRDMCTATLKTIVKEKDRKSAENAVMEALKPFREEQEREIYKAAKKFVEAYEANDLVK